MKSKIVMNELASMLAAEAVCLLDLTLILLVLIYKTVLVHIITFVKLEREYSDSVCACVSINLKISPTVFLFLKFSVVLLPN